MTKTWKGQKYLDCLGDYLLMGDKCRLCLLETRLDCIGFHRLQGSGEDE